MGYYFGGIFTVEIIGFFGIIAHSHHFFPFHHCRHGVPYKFAGSCPGKIPHILRFVYPCFFTGCLIFFISYSIIQRNDLERLLHRLCLLPLLILCRAQHLVVIAAFAGGADDMIIRYGHFYFKIPKGQRKFSASGKLEVLPALEIRIHRHAGIPLAHDKHIIPVLREILIAATPHLVIAIHDLIIPVYAEYKFLTRKQLPGKVNPHHGMINRIGQLFARGCYLRYLHPVILHLTPGFEVHDLVVIH